MADLLRPFSGLKKGFHLSPSLLSADTAELAEAVKKVEAAGVDSLHIDVMDGHYVKNFAFSPKNTTDLTQITNLPLHVHLETDNPDDCIPLFSSARMIIVQEDTSPDLEGTLERLSCNGQEAGLGVNLDRPVERVFTFLSRVSLVLIMAVEPGFGGQTFRPEALDKIRLLRQERDRSQHPFWIGIDGGMNPTTLINALQAGADCFIIGSGIFGSGKKEDPPVDSARRVRMYSQLMRRAENGSPLYHDEITGFQ